MAVFGIQLEQSFLKTMDRNLEGSKSLRQQSIKLDHLSPSRKVRDFSGSQTTKVLAWITQMCNPHVASDWICSVAMGTSTLVHCIHDSILLQPTAQSTSSGSPKVPGPTHTLSRPSFEGTFFFACITIVLKVSTCKIPNLQEVLKEVRMLLSQWLQTDLQLKVAAEDLKLLNHLARQILYPKMVQMLLVSAEHTLVHGYQQVCELQLCCHFTCDLIFVCPARSMYSILEPCFLCDNPANVKFEPCGHCLMCSQCAEKAKRCPTCRVSHISCQYHNMNG